MMSLHQKIPNSAHQSLKVAVKRWLHVSLLMVVTTGCSRQIEEDPPIPEHRIETCGKWCAMIFDPECPEGVEVDTEAECLEMCTNSYGVWAPESDGHDDCAATYIPFVDCMASLSCDERREHFDLVNIVPTEEQSSCGALLRLQLDCQTAHY